MVRVLRVRVLRRHRCKVIATDILSGTDFLEEERSVPNVATNPALQTDAQVCGARKEHGDKKGGDASIT